MFLPSVHICLYTLTCENQNTLEIIILSCALTFASKKDSLTSHTPQDYQYQSSSTRLFRLCLAFKKQSGRVRAPCSRPAAKISLCLCQSVCKQTKRHTCTNVFEKSCNLVELKQYCILKKTSEPNIIVMHTQPMQHAQQALLRSSVLSSIHTIS